MAHTFEDKFVSVDGLKIRYIEAGSGHPVVFLHGGSLGSSADVFRRNLSGFSAAGFRAIAFDQPGFGRSGTPQDHSNGYRRKSIPAFVNALGLTRPALVAHSQAGGMAVPLVDADPQAWSHLVILGTGSLLPALDEAKPVEGQAQARLERRMAQKEPTLDDTRKLLEANLFHHELITDEELSLRHAMSVGPAFEAFVARNAQADRSNKEGKDKAAQWLRLPELRIPLLMIYGRQDRGQAEAKATLLKEKLPQLDLHIVDGCKHLVPWDAEAEVLRLGVPFLKR